jgi:hypothetical protein
MPTFLLIGLAADAEPASADAGGEADEEEGGHGSS